MSTDITITVPDEAVEPLLKLAGITRRYEAPTPRFYLQPVHQELCGYEFVWMRDEALRCALLILADEGRHMDPEMPVWPEPNRWEQVTWDPRSAA